MQEVSAERQPLHEAAYDGNEISVKLLLEGGADIEAADLLGRTSLHHAAMTPLSRAIESLLKAGANVNAKSERGKTPLHEAAYYGSETSVKLMLEGGADVKARCSSGKSALDLVIKNSEARELRREERLEKVRMLQEATDRLEEKKRDESV